MNEYCITGYDKYICKRNKRRNEISLYTGEPSSNDFVGR